jgi:hypothetical protein
VPEQPSIATYLVVFAAILIAMALGAGVERTFGWLVILSGAIAVAISFGLFGKYFTSNSGLGQFSEAMATIFVWISGAIFLFGVLFALKVVATPILRVFSSQSYEDSELPENWRY